MLTHAGMTGEAQPEHRHPMTDRPRPTRSLWHAALLAIGLLPAGMSQSTLAQGADERLPDTVIISAERAERINPDLIELSGHFELQADDWSLQADEARVHGPLQSPLRVVVSGTPARVSVRVGETARVVTASGQQIEYQRDTALVRVSGEAVLNDGERRLSGGYIDYDLSAGRLLARGEPGARPRVQLRLPPQTRNRDSDNGDGDANPASGPADGPEGRR